MEMPKEELQNSALHLEEVKGLGHPGGFAVLELSLLLDPYAHLASEHLQSPAGGQEKRFFVGRIFFHLCCCCFLS